MMVHDNSCVNINWLAWKWGFPVRKVLPNTSGVEPSTGVLLETVARWRVWHFRSHPKKDHSMFEPQTSNWKKVTFPWCVCVCVCHAQEIFLGLVMFGLQDFSGHLSDQRFFSIYRPVVWDKPNASRKHPQSSRTFQRGWDASPSHGWWHIISCTSGRFIKDLIDH